jgi:hypothetical protein
LSFLAGTVPQVGIALARALRTKDYHRTIGMCRIDRDLYIACGVVTSTGPGSRCSYPTGCVSANTTPPEKAGPIAHAATISL